MKQAKRAKNVIAAVTRATAYDIVVNKIRLLGRSRSADGIATFLRDIYAGLNRFAGLTKKLVYSGVCDAHSVAELLFDMNRCLLRFRESIPHVRKPLRRAINYCYCGTGRECDEVRLAKIRCHVDMIKKCMRLIELGNAVGSKTDEEVLAYVNDSKVDILSNIGSSSDPMTREHIKIAYDISRVIATGLSESDQLKIKVVRSLWGDWARLLADICILKKELEELLIKLRGAGHENKEEIASVLVEIDVKILGHLNSKVREFNKIFG